MTSELFSGFPCGSVVKNLPAMQKMQEMLRVRSLGQEDPLEEGLATYSSILTLVNPMNRGDWIPVYGIHQGKNTGVGSHSLLQGIFLTQGSNPQCGQGSPKYGADSLPSEPAGKSL